MLPETSAALCRDPMAQRRIRILVAALLALTGCARAADLPPTPMPIPPGTSPREALLGRPPTDTDCFTTAFVLVQVPDGPTLERHVVTAVRRPTWLPLRGFLGTPAQLAQAVRGQLITDDPQTAWILVRDADLPRADRYFPLIARSGERVWYRDGSVAACI